MMDSGVSGTAPDSGDSAIGSTEQHPIYGPASTAWEYQHSSISDGASSSGQMSVSTDIESTVLTGEGLAVRVCYRYLSSLPYTQWSIWDISMAEHRLMAARWLADQIEAVDTLLRRHNV